MAGILEVIAKLKDTLWHKYGNVLQKQYSQHEIHMTYYVSTLLDNTGLGPDNDYRYTQQSVNAAFIAGLRVGEKNAKEIADIIVKDRIADAIGALEGRRRAWND